MYILGISCYYHDSAACVIKDGEVITAVEEERFSRKKFDDGFPSQAIDYCMNDAGISANELDCIAFYDKTVLKFERLLDNYIALAPLGLKSFIDVIPKWLHKRLWLKEEIKNHLKYDGKIIFPEHHVSHAAYAFFTSPFSESAILSVDGVGEWTTSAFGTGHDTSINLTNDIRWPHSLGLFYSAFTYYLGFKVNEGEYKLMGLAAYGKPKFYDLIMDNLIDVKEDGSIHLPRRDSGLRVLEQEREGRLPLKSGCDRSRYPHPFLGCLRGCPVSTSRGKERRAPHRFISDLARAHEGVLGVFRGPYTART